MKTAGKKNRSTIDNLVIMNAIIKKNKDEYFCILYTKTYCMRMHKNASTNSG